MRRICTYNLEIGLSSAYDNRADVNIDILLSLCQFHLKALNKVLSNINSKAVYKINYCFLERHLNGCNFILVVSSTFI